MPETRARARKGKGRLLGQPTWAVGLELGGAVLLFLWFRHRERSAAAAAALTSTAGAPVSSSPVNVGQGSSSGTSTSPTSLAGWEQEALNAMIGAGADPGTAYNALSDFLSGNQLDPAGYKAITGALASIGLPPGITSLSPLSVASTSTPAATPSPFTPASAFAQEGQGFGSYPNANVVTAEGTYFPLTPTAAAGLAAQGKTAYYFPDPGVAQPATGVPFSQPTPLYGKL